jgi:tRNA threonylcarbamoyladenosine biosynthesis protein TsaE
MTVAETTPAYAAGRMDEAALGRFAAKAAAVLRPPCVIFLEGDLGAGKTTFCRALIQSLGHPGRVKSPTYGLLERYELAALDVLHLDLYRIGDPGELEYLALADLFDERTVLLVEWPERGAGALPAADLTIRLEHADDQRFVYLTPHSERGGTVCKILTEWSSS